ncbi:MAG: T9SS type A sorting domain-containing protein, partial [Flavobacteriales bacterium]|nr:T9SS type A sorting domain-containing protein [Flavobacteriales bacterium]
GVFSIQLTTFSTDGNCSDQTTVDIDVLLVSVDEMDWTGSVYPNPTHGTVIFESSEAIESIQVFRISGALVQSETPNRMRWMMDTADWAEGIYVVRIQTAMGTKSLKLVRGA